VKDLKFRAKAPAEDRKFRDPVKRFFGLFLERENQ